MPRLCVFCGSNVGARPEYAAAAREFAAAAVRRGLGLVYGGGNVGLMGVVADAALAAGGEVIGVIPSALQAKELAHAGLTELHVVRSMHERKAVMADLSDGFAALPGGVGTLEELFEILTWGQLGIHAKPVGVLDTAGFYQPLLRFLDHQVEERFLKPKHRALVHVAAEPERLLDMLSKAPPGPAEPKWLDESRR
jgi:uncharacterized protein (TIGR00730 family)